MDYQSLLYDPVYLIQGVAGSINGIGGFTVLDKTAGLEVTPLGETQLQTVKCAAVVRYRELQVLGISLDALIHGSLIMNGAAWRIESYLLKPSPNGQYDGEVVLFLLETSESESESDSA